MKYFFFLPEIRAGGSENFIINFANFLKYKNNNVHILSIKKNKNIFKQIHKDIVYTELPKNRFKKFIKIKSLLRKNNPDKIISILGISFYLLILIFVLFLHLNFLYDQKIIYPDYNF